MLSFIKNNQTKIVETLKVIYTLALTLVAVWA